MHSICRHFLLLTTAACLVVTLATREGRCDDRKTTPGMSAEHSALHENLSRRVNLEIKDATVGEILDALSDSLGAPVTFEGEVELLGGEATTPFEFAGTHWRAIEQLAYAVGWDWAELAIHGGGISIVKYRKAKDRRVLRRHDLSGFSDYTTAKRPHLIERIRAEVAPDNWGQGAGAWVVPSASVFEIDVYQTLDIHEQIKKFIREAEFVARYTAEERKAEGEHELLLFWLGQIKADEALPEELQESFQKLRATFPFRSLSKNLKELESPPVRRHPEVKLKESISRRLDEFEENFGREGAWKVNWSSYRKASLKRLHTENVAEFVSREGFGVSRISPPGPDHLRLEVTPRLTLPSANVLPVGGNELQARIPLNDVEAATADTPLPTQDLLTALHTRGQSNFLSPYRFGHFKDRDHVAGFQPHAFTDVPRMKDVDEESRYTERTEHWAVRRLELVSLLKHEKPAVYISDELPRMDELADAPTRKLNPFEAAALRALNEGEDVITRGTTNRIEMVGSLRAIKQCADCHDAQRGQLLGAFSYELVRDPLISSADVAP